MRCGAATSCAAWQARSSRSLTQWSDCARSRLRSGKSSVRRDGDERSLRNPYTLALEGIERDPLSSPRGSGRVAGDARGSSRACRRRDAGSESSTPSGCRRRKPWRRAAHSRRIFAASGARAICCSWPCSGDERGCEHVCKLGVARRNDLCRHPPYIAPTTLPVPLYPPIAQTSGRTCSNTGSTPSEYPTDAAQRRCTGCVTPSVVLRIVSMQSWTSHVGDVSSSILRSRNDLGNRQARCDGRVAAANSRNPNGDTQAA